MEGISHESHHEFTCQPNHYLASFIAAAAQKRKAVRFDDEDEHESRTELDSHANMPVVDQNSYVISDTGKMAEVNPYNPDYKSMRLPIVDAAIQYDCPYTGK